MNFSESFHLAKKVDLLEKRLEQKQDIEIVFDELVDELNKKPGDPELVRQANLLINRLEDFVAQLKSKTQTRQ